MNMKIQVPKQKGGRVSKLSQRDKTFCVRSVTKDGKSNATQVQKALKPTFGTEVSLSTVRRILNEAGLVSFVKPKKPLLSVKNVSARKAFAEKHMSWTLDDWCRIRL